MNRNQKIAKLANAIRDYRGMINNKTGKWIHPPKPVEMLRVQRWLTALGLDVIAGIHLVDNFQSFDQFNKWLNTL